MGERIYIALICKECSSRNYRTTRKRVQGAVPLELKKFCATCDKHTVHRESK